LLSGILNTFVIFFARVIAGAISTALRDEWRWLGQLSYFLIVIVLDIILWLFASLILMWYSRRREFRADAWAARYVGTWHMIDALRRLGESHKQKAKQDAFALMKISWWKVWMKMFSSHPPLEKRIEALQTGEYIAQS
jgi:heat shock protein HtpX